MSARFITFEGGEGAGKSTQIKRLAGRLQELGHAVVQTREPGGSPRAERIRAALLAGAAKNFGPFAEAMMFAAARADHLNTTIRPALARGSVVLCDRFTDSTRVYQGEAGVDPALLDALADVTIEATRPDLTLILDVPAKLGLARAAARRAVLGEAPDRFESEAIEHHERLRQRFLAIAAQEPERCAVIEAFANPEAVERAIWTVVSARLAPVASLPKVVPWP